MCVIIPYPTSPFLYNILGPFPKIAYALLILVIVVMMMSKRYRSEPILDSFWTKTMAFLVISSLTFEFLLSGNISVFRDVLLFSFTYIFCFRLSSFAFFDCLRKYILINSILLMLSLAFISAWFLGLITLENWAIQQLSYLTELNPLIVRSKQGDFIWHFVGYLSVIPLPSIDAQYFRLPLHFTEPHYLWFYICPLFLYTIGDRRMKYRGFVLISTGISLGVSLSVYGLLILTALTAIFIFSPFLKYRSIRYFAFFVGLLFTIYFFQSDMHIDLIKWIGGGKLSQLKTLISTVSSKFSNSTYYGIFGILSRYSAVSLSILIVLFCVLLFKNMMFLFQSLGRFAKTPYFIVFSALFSLIDAIKTPQYILVVPLIFYSAILHTRLRPDLIK
jgi:hypothetical protein